MALSGEAGAKENQDAAARESGLLGIKTLGMPLQTEYGKRFVYDSLRTVIISAALYDL